MNPRSPEPIPSHRWAHRPGRSLLWIAGALLALGRPLPGDELRLDHVEHLSVEDGLAHSSVWDIQQDRLGFLWLATEAHLQRYDGYELTDTKHDPDDPHSLSASEVMEIFEDHQGVLWFSTRAAGLNRFDRARERFVRYRHDPADATSLADDVVTAICEDRSGTLWVGTLEGLDQFHRQDGTFTHVRHDPEDPHSLGHNEVYAVLEDREGALWVGTAEGLDRRQPGDGTFAHYRHDPDDPRSLSHNVVLELYEDTFGSLWVGTEAGLNRFDRTRGTFVRYRELLEITAIHEDRTGALWIATHGHGLSRLAGPAAGPPRDREGRSSICPPPGEPSICPPPGEPFIHYRHDPGDPHGLSSDHLLAIHEDRSGILWIASRKGIDKIDPRRERFAVFRRTDPEAGVGGDQVWAVTEDHAGVLWIGTLDGGLTGLDRGSADRAPTTAVHYGSQPDGPLPENSVTALLDDRNGELWIGTSTNGLVRLDRSRRRFVSELAGKMVRCLLEDNAGDLWIGTFDGLHQRRAASGDFVHYPHDSTEPTSLGGDLVHDLYEDRSGNLWILTSDGLDRLDRETGPFVHYRHDPQSPSLSSNLVLSLYEDAEGILWVGTTDSGLNRWDRSRDEFRVYRERDGLPSDKVTGILGDPRGFLWIATPRGLVRFDPGSETFRTYDIDDGLHGNVFFIDVAFRSARGELFFGGDGGLTAFFPERIEEDSVAPPVVLTKLRLGDEPAPLRWRAADSPLEQAITETRELVLGHRERTFSFEFAALHFASPRKNRYAYQLEGYDEDWIETDAGRRLARYTNLDPGRYVFRVKAGNQDGVWNEEGTSIRITVRPPPWKTWWACTLYGLGLAAVVLGYLRLQHNKLRREHEAAEREREISARLREVDKLKDEFLANTSHELRTPLYGITGLAESLIDGASGELPEQAKGNLAMIVSSGQRLTRLINDILDHSRLTHQSLELERRPVDLRSLTDVVLTLLRPLAGGKELELVNSIPAELPPADADENRLEQILYNLLGNAVKFTASGKVGISARSEDGRLLVTVEDTGIGIPHSKLQQIFGAFQQADSSIIRAFGGTGLGLTVTRKLVELHGGTIRVESTLGEGTSFHFTLPISEQEVQVAPSLAPETEPLPAAPPSERIQDAESEPPPGTPRILIVDDEPVNLQVVRNHLARESYPLTLASSGEEALRLLKEQSFDLVLLDIMMPKLSGYEVCRILRQSHPMAELPVIFLTAKDRESDVVTGFSLGANDYLTKPISKGELLARVESQLKLLGVHRHLEHLVEDKLSQIKVLQGLLPICCQCKKIRDDEGYWTQLEVFIDTHSEAQFTHGICPDCGREFLRQFESKGIG
ncbi:MAG: response regulator [bacterium]|nr:response regulator [bacterium]